MGCVVWRGWPIKLACVATGFAAGFMGVALTVGQQAARLQIDDKVLRQLFARPVGVPHPPDNPPTPEKIALGERLFNDVRLSGNGQISCASCHDARLGFADGTPRSRSGTSGRELIRHTPALWNLAWAPLLMWDGRAASLEAQIVLPVEHPDEMGGSLEKTVERLAANADMRNAFARAFPDSPAVSAANIAKAIASYERTLVSSPTRFDRWINGDAAALSPQERAGLGLFVGKARCVSCHTGFSFTDHAFHDVGLPTSDLGRGPVARIPAVNHAFKTPALREIAWSAPYMHDGSLATIEDVVRHYEGGGVARPTRSKDMPRQLSLTDEERAGLVAFLDTLSSDAPPRPSSEAWVGSIALPARSKVVVAATAISQRNKLFAPDAVKVARGATITILNDDTQTHNVRIASSSLDYNSGAQEPGESVHLRLDTNGLFEAHCAIHPTMRLLIEVE